MRYALIRQTAPTDEQQQYVPKGKRHRWIAGGLFARIGMLIDKGADFLLTIKWIRGTQSSKRYRAVRAIARRMSLGNGRKAASVAAAMAFGRRHRDGVTCSTEAQLRGFFFSLTPTAQ
jgi:hypothetical protein